MRTLLSILLLAVAVLAAGSGLVMGADISGKWAGSVEFKTPDGDTDSGGAYAVLKQNGQEVTGTAGPEEEQQFAIENGKLEGKKLTFQLSLPGDAGSRVFKLSLTLASDDQMEGDIEGLTNNGAKLTGKLKLTRKAA